MLWSIYLSSDRDRLLLGLCLPVLRLMLDMRVFIKGIINAPRL